MNRLGVTRDELVDIVRACVAGRGGATDNDPRSAGGQLAWILGTRRMREVFRKKGLDKEVLNGVETVVDHLRMNRFVVVSTDNGTSDPNRSPRNRTEKGPASEQITDLNNELLRPFSQAPNPPSETVALR